MVGLPHIVIREEVSRALDQGGPVVALESTLITHGLQAPLNGETAAEMEREVRTAGATPATIAVIDGTIRIGLCGQELHDLASAVHAVKISSRALPGAVSERLTGGTTVSATMFVSAAVRIGFFATGGIGGVHHGADQTGDVSSDLTELARTPVAVVCSGVKSILDIGRTLEYLETSGVPVYGYQTDSFPGFFSGESGFRAPQRLDGPEQAAAAWRVHRELGLPGGIVIACTPPAGVANAEDLDRAVQQANAEAFEQGVRGGEVTPFVLRRVAELTNGASLQVNTALLRSNARTAAEIAVAGTSSNRSPRQ